MSKYRYSIYIEISCSSGLYFPRVYQCQYSSLSYCKKYIANLLTRYYFLEKKENHFISVFVCRHEPGIHSSEKEIYRVKVHNEK